MKTYTYAAIKEGVRIVLLAIIPILYSSVNMTTGAIHINWSLIGGTIFIAILRALDKWVHDNPHTDATGILPF